MIIYWSTCFLSALFAYFSMNNKMGREHRSLTALFSAIPMIVIAAIRYDVGVDYLFTYVPYYQAVESQVLSANSQMERLFHLVNLFVSKESLGYMFVFGICAAIFFLACYSQIFRDSPYPAYSIFLLVGMNFVFVSFNAVRQMVGCSILLFSLRYVLEKKPVLFYLCVILATLFHTTCLVYLIVYPFCRIKVKPIYAFLLTGVVLLSRPILVPVIKLIILQTPYASYFNSVFNTGRVAYVSLAIYSSIFLLESLLFCEREDYILYYNLQMISVWVIAFTGHIVLMLRILWIFGLPSVISLPLALTNIKNQRDRLFVMAGIATLFILYTIYTVGLQNSNGVLPYKTIFGR